MKDRDFVLASPAVRLGSEVQWTRSVECLEGELFGFGSGGYPCGCECPPPLSSVMAGHLVLAPDEVFERTGRPKRFIEEWWFSGAGSDLVATAR